MHVQESILRRGRVIMRMEKRRNPRLDFGVMVYCNDRRVITSNLSSNGVFIGKDERNERLHLVPIGSEIHLSFDFPTARNYIDITGTVVHHGNNKNGMGICFNRIDDRTRKFIRIFVSDYLQGVFFHEPTF